MRYRYSSFYHIRGLVPSSPAIDDEVFADTSQDTRAVLTSNPVPLCDQLDNSCAIANMLLDGFLGGANESGTVEERLTQQVSRLREQREKKFVNGVYLLFDARGHCPPITPLHERDCGAYVLALDGLPTKDFHNRHEPLVKKILVAVGLGVASVSGFEKISDGTIFFSDSGKPIYGFNFDFGMPELLISRHASAEDLAATRQLALRIANDDANERVIRLLNESLEPDLEKLRRFLSAWMALEVFVNMNFGIYAKRFWDSLSNGVSAPIRERYLKRIHEVMSDKYKPLDKIRADIR